MKQDTVLKLSLSISLSGILLLLFLVNTLEPELITINQTQNKPINQKIKLQGQIIDIKDKNSFQLLTIQDSTGQINIIANSNISQKKQNITVTGKITEYQEELQISADKILLQTS